MTRFVRDFANARGWVDTPDSGRHFHPKPVPRLGGLCILAAFLGALGISFILSSPAISLSGISVRTTLAIMGPALIVFLSGLYDDLYSLGPYWKFGVQIVAAVLLYVGGFGIQQFDLFSRTSALGIYLGLPLTVFWVVLITNAFNLIDGLDGLAAGSALFSVIIIFVVSSFLHTSLVSFLAIALAGAIFGFLRFNFNPATIFLGDSGSLFIGFILSALALAGSQKATTMVAVAIPVVSFGLPIMDVLISVVRRFLSGKPLFKGDHNHIHHKLLKRGFSHRSAVLILYAVSAAFGMLSLSLLHGRGIVALVLAVIGLGVLAGIQQLQYSEFSELVAFFSQLQPRQAIANRLQIRRATELLATCQDASTFCRILNETMSPLGFEGFSVRMFTNLTDREPQCPPLMKNGLGELKYTWTVSDSRGVAWELKLDLVSGGGEKCGSLSFHRLSQSRPLLMDINLLTDGFQTALSSAVQRTLLQKAIPMSHHQPQIPAKAQAKSAGTTEGK